MVVDSTGRACGVVSSDDILQLVAREIYGLGRVVQRELEKEQLSRSPSRDTSDQTEMAFDAPLYQEAKEIPGFAR